jgi:hypothetical protein
MAPARAAQQLLWRWNCGHGVHGLYHSVRPSSLQSPCLPGPRRARRVWRTVRCAVLARHVSCGVGLRHLHLSLAKSMFLEGSKRFNALGNNFCAQDVGQTPGHMGSPRRPRVSPALWERGALVGAQSCWTSQPPFAYTTPSPCLPSWPPPPGGEKWPSPGRSAGGSRGRC